MNKRQKEVLQSQLNDEKAIIKKVKGIYNKALEDIDDKIAVLLAREDKENLQSIIYQVDYQKALKTQINAILDTMNTEQFTSISDYLTKCYNEGFLGTMYDLQGQGIPLIFPINQEQVIKAIQHDTKLSKKLYTKLGEDVDLLKKRISNNIARGISQGSSYSEIARNIKGNSNITMNQALRISRTEGHRISQQATFDAQNKAKEKGADVVKQWDSTMDSRTRPTHVKLDGQIRELDEEFEANGHHAMYPGGFGIASEDVNCRCVVLQRAKWGLTDEEYTKMNGNTGELVRLKEKEYNKFKEEYSNKLNEVEKFKKNYETDFAKKFGNDYYDELHQRVVNCSDQNLASVWKQYESDIKVGNAKYNGHEYCSGNTIYVNGVKDAKGNSWEAPYQVTFHESGHAIDSLAKNHSSVQNPKIFGNHYSSLYKDGLFPQTIKDEVNEWVSVVDKKLKAKFKEHTGDVEWFRNNGFISDWMYDMYEKGVYDIKTVIPKYRKSYAYSAIQNEIKSLPAIAKADLSDILEGATDAKIKCGFGHGASYWKDRTFMGVPDGLATEAFAEMTDSTMACPESLEVIKKYLPKSYAVYQEMIKELLK